MSIRWCADDVVEDLAPRIDEPCSRGQIVVDQLRLAERSAYSHLERAHLVMLGKNMLPFGRAAMDGVSEGVGFGPAVGWRRHAGESIAHRPMESADR